jgi:hypothetical protein
MELPPSGLSHTVPAYQLSGHHCEFCTGGALTFLDEKAE